MVIDGRKHWFAAIISPFSKGTVLWITRDITRRKKAEEALRESEKRYKLTTTLSGHIVYEYNVRENVISWGGAIEEVSGYTPIEYERIDTTQWIDMIHTEDRAKTLEMFRHAIANNIQFHTECRYQHKNGTYIWLEIHGFTLSAHRGEVYKTLGVMKDITQRKRHEQQMLNSVVNTEESERISFSQELHDGLGPLLSAIKMYVQWLGKPAVNISKQEILKDLENLTDEAYHTVREISFRLSPHILKNYGLNDALRVYADRVKESAQIDFNFELANHIRFDGIVETVIYRVLCECINNTVKHAEAKLITIAIGVEEPYINVDYSDNGKGFDLDEIKGTYKGIGLLNMESRVTSINGIMNIISNPGQGFQVNIKVKTSGV
jgi:PAS domain S-box-containing protein